MMNHDTNNGRESDFWGKEEISGHFDFFFLLIHLIDDKLYVLKLNQLKNYIIIFTSFSCLSTFVSCNKLNWWIIFKKI
jgi:hypothetical protein